MLEGLRHAVVNFVLDRPSGPKALVWRRVASLGPVKLADGSWSKIGGGQLWRRAHAGRWEYRQDHETADDFDSKTW